MTMGRRGPKPKPPLVKCCPQCGNKFAVRGYRSRQQFCSPECARRFQSQLVECQLCGANFSTRKTRLATICAKCRSIAVLPETRACSVCGRGFRRTYNQRNKIICSVACRNWTANESKVNWKTCPHCKSAFRAKKKKHEFYCSRDCYDADRSRVHSRCASGGKSDWYRGKTDRYHRYRAARFGVLFEKVSIPSVYEDDKWICGVCKKPVDRDLHWPHPLSASLDHIVPLYRGGSHTRDNVRLSHLSCNINRGGIEQLPLLFGAPAHA